MNGPYMKCYCANRKVLFSVIVVYLVYKVKLNLMLRILRFLVKVQ